MEHNARYIYIYIQGDKRKGLIIDILAILILTVCIGFLAFGHLNNSCQWGDDFAAYINQGIAIAEGRFEEQIRLNYMMHPSFMPDEAVDGELVYVWGYSLILALVYKLVGFDRLGYSSILFYKIPSAVALILLSAVIYLFLRRRFGYKLSFFLSLFFCTCAEFYIFLDTMYSDLVFLFFAVLAFYLFELFIDASGKKRWLLAVFSGICLWFMYEVRLNGIAVLFACVFAHVIWLFRLKKKGISPDLKSLLPELLPYAVFLLLKITSEAILAPATSNASDIVGTNFGTIYGNMRHYFGMIRDWYASMWKNIIQTFLLLGYTPRNNNTLYYVSSFLSWSSVILCAVGIVFDGIKRNLHYTAFLGVYLFVSCMLFYNQGLRYIYPILPILLMFTGYGLVRIVGVIKLPEKLRRVGSFAMLFVVLGFSACLVYPRYVQVVNVQQNQGPDAAYASAEVSAQQNAYSSSALEVYEYINSNLPEDCVIGFFKPRALYLNTQRMSLALSSLLDNSLDDVDYYLIFRHMIIDPEPTEDFVAIWENQDFIMMEKQA